MTIQPFRKIRTGDDELRQVQDATALVFTSLNREIIDGQILSDISIIEDPANPGTFLPTKVDHKLGRAFKGWIVINKTSQADIWQYVPTTAYFPTLSITFKASAAVTFSIWIF